MSEEAAAEKAEAPAPAPAPSPRSWMWRSVLVVSLALNLLALGAIVAHVVFGPPLPDRVVGFSSMQILPRKFISDLEGDRRARILEILRGYRSDFDERRGEMRAATDKIVKALQAEPYDPAALTAAVDQFAASGHTLIDGGVATVKAVLNQLTDKERHLLADRIRERADRRRR